MIKQVYFKIRWLPGRIKNAVAFRMRGVKVGDNFHSLGSIFIRGKGKIVIGDNVTINSSLESNPIGGGIERYFI